MQARSGSAPAKTDARQLSIFDLETVANDRIDDPPQQEVAREQVASEHSNASTHVRQPVAPVRVITTEGLPHYSTEVIEQVDRSIAALPTEKLWFTYHDIHRCFGVSRATVARRMKDGVVPGVRFQLGRMIEDGAVRRLDREQLRWLLLAVRSGPQRVQHAVAATSKQ
ncbi:MAG: hypothetical protein ABL871_15645 [Terricaulis sp.]